MQPAVSPSFNNGQLELLKILSRELSEEELLALRRLLGQFFAQRATEAMGKVWDENGWTNETMTQMLNTKMRKQL